MSGAAISKLHRSILNCEVEGTPIAPYLNYSLPKRQTAGNPQEIETILIVNPPSTDTVSPVIPSYFPMQKRLKILSSTSSV